MGKIDLVNDRLNFKYPDINKLVTDNSVSEEDIKNYMNYCDTVKNPAVKNYTCYNTFKELKEKCKKKGLESIIFRKDVIGVTKNHYSGDRDYPACYYLTIDTLYGSFQYGNRVG